LYLTIETLPPLSLGYFKPWQLFANILHIAKKTKIDSGLCRARLEVNYVVDWLIDHALSR